MGEDPWLAVVESGGVKRDDGGVMNEELGVAGVGADAVVVDGFVPNPRRRIKKNR